MYTDSENASATARRVKCPTCGQRNRVAEGRPGKKIKCSACEHRFVSADYESIGDASPIPVPCSTGSSNPTIWERIFRDPSAALEGAIPGASSGICAGIFGPILVGIVSEQSFGEILGRILLGFMVGFGVGAFLGAIFAGRMRRGQTDLRIEPGWTISAAGAFIGSVVGLAVEPVWWFPLVAATGAVGANLWPLLCKKLESAVDGPIHMKLEDDLSPEGGE